MRNEAKQSRDRSFYQSRDRSEAAEREGAVPSVKLFHGDCLRLLDRIPDGSIDMVLCDLPYGRLDCAWDKPIPLAPLWEQWKRVTKPNAAIVLFAMQSFATDVINSNRKWFRYEWIWDKKYSTNFGHAKRRPLRQHENILVFYRSRATYRPQGLRSYMIKRRGWVGVCSFTGGRFGTARYIQRHTGYPRSILLSPKYSNAAPPGSKPAALCEYLIRTHTRPGETVLDNAMGLGSAGVAAVRSGRGFVGMELDRDRFERARANIRRAGGSGSLGGLRR